MRRKMMSLLLGIMIILGGNISVLAAEEDALESKLEGIVQENINIINNFDEPEIENGTAKDQKEDTDKVEDIGEQAIIKEKRSDAEFSLIDANGLKWEVKDGVLSISGNGVIERNASFTNNDELREGITSIIIGEGITKIGTEAFFGFRYLEEAAIPDSVIIIDKYAFEACESLLKVAIPDSVREIGAGAFARCGLTTVQLPNGLTEIDEETFSDCRQLSEIIIPDSVTKIGYGAFSGCNAITSTRFLPESVKEIGGAAFANCQNLTEVSLPGNVAEICESMFYDCGKLSEITIPDSVTCIENTAFYLCTGLTTVIIPDSVKKIGWEAFSYCTGLQTIIFQGDAPELAGDASEYGSPFLGVTATAYYPLGNPTYTEEVKVKYGTGLTWEAKGPLKIILETTKNTHVLGTSDTATITCNGELKDFVNVFVDGAEVSKSNYILEEGSTILTFTAQYLNTLSVGKHAVTMNYTYGSVDTELIILSSDAVNSASSAGESRKAEVSVKSIAAKTGDNEAVLPWLLLVLTAAAVGVGTVFIRRRYFD